MANGFLADWPSNWVAGATISVPAGTAGAPPATTRTGLPQVWASTQKKV